MKNFSRGFTLIELMIVIAIIAMLAAALFPSLMSYLARGRDTQRIAAIKEIGIAVTSYITDIQKLPPGTSSTASGGMANCVSPSVLISQLTKYPYDMNPISIGHCGITGLYGYGTGINNGSNVVLFSAFFENPIGGNTATGVILFQGNGVSTGAMLIINTPQNGAGSGYVIRN